VHTVVKIFRKACLEYMERCDRCARDDHATKTYRERPETPQRCPNRLVLGLKSQKIGLSRVIPEKECLS
jgi:hypothetical protein